MSLHELLLGFLLYALLPLWLVAGMGDWLCHRATGIASTSGIKESALHLALFVEAGVPLLAGLLLEINAGVLATMLIALLLHNATTLWDLSYAQSRRHIPPVEQHIHSFLEVIPIMAVALVALLNWDQFLALFGLGAEAVDFSLRWRQPPLPPLYLGSIIAAALLFNLLPFAEEFWRGWRTRAVQSL